MRDAVKFHPNLRYNRYTGRLSVSNQVGNFAFHVIENWPEFLLVLLAHIKTPDGATLAASKRLLTKYLHYAERCGRCFEREGARSSADACYAFALYATLLLALHVKLFGTAPPVLRCTSSARVRRRSSCEKAALSNAICRGAIWVLFLERKRRSPTTVRT